ncbi:MAG: penicillin acylase family protein [Flavobacteriales bacterium]
MRIWIKRILLGLLLLVALGVVYIYFWLGSSKPEYSGTLQLPGLQHKVDVHYDEYGVPHIHAQNKHDMYMAFGYVHAQDRLFQMEMLRRAGSGRLSEIIGRPVLKVDKMFRSLGLQEYAAESAAYLRSQKGTPMYDEVQAYMDGINHFVSHGETPPEFSIIGIEKTPFTFEDLYCATGAMAFSFSMAQKTEPVVDFIQKQYGEQYLHDIGLWHDSTESFIPATPPQLQNPVRTKSLQQEEKESEQEDETDATEEYIGENAYDALLQLSQAISEVEAALPYAPIQGSNAWALSGTKTKSGRVMFCNDTHIGYMIPQTWYEAHLVCPGFEMYGHHFAGVPFALIGRNHELSWGITMLENDEMDFYRETFDSTNTNSYLHEHEWKDADVRSYAIKIKDEADTTIQVRYTLHGPVVNDAFEGMGALPPISMFWTYTKHPNRTLDAFYGLNNAHNMHEFESHLPLIHAPGLSINYGDSAGNIAWWACASLIKRPADVNSWTLLDGASGVEDAQGYYPFELNPRNINPSCGYIYSANDWPQAMDTELTVSADSMQVLSADLYNRLMNSHRAIPRFRNESEDSIVMQQYLLAQAQNMANKKLWYPGYYKPQYRANRIRQLLEGSNEWDMTSMQDVMCDVTNTMDSSMMRWFWNELRDTSVFVDSNYFRQFDEVLMWKGDYDPRIPQPTFFNKMLYHYLHYTMADELGEERFNLFMQTHQWQRTYTFLFRQKDSPWWNDVRTTQTENRRDIIYKAYCKSIEDLCEQFGNNPKIWTWQKAASLEFRHPLGEVAALRPIFNIGPTGVWGGNETILQSGFKLDSTGVYKISYGSQMRIIVDFAHVDSTLNVTPTGQSGHVMSDYYSNQAELYRNRKFRTAWMSKSKIEAMSKLELTP